MQNLNKCLIIAALLLTSCASDDEVTLNSIDEESLKKERAQLEPLSQTDFKNPYQSRPFSRGDM